MAWQDDVIRGSDADPYTYYPDHFEGNLGANIAGGRVEPVTDPAYVRTEDAE